MTQYLKIREFSDLVGLSPTTVRKYEEEGIYQLECRSFFILFGFS